MKLFAKITVFPCLLITFTVPLFFMLTSYTITTPSENPCLLWLIALFFALTILDTLQNVLYGPLLALNASITALSITSFTFGLIVTVLVVVVGYNRDSNQNLGKDDDTETIFSTLPDYWTQLILLIGLLLQTALYLDYVFECKVSEKRDEIMERAEIDKDRIRSAMSSPEFVEGGISSARVDSLLSTEKSDKRAFFNSKSQNTRGLFDEEMGQKVEFDKK